MCCCYRDFILRAAASIRTSLPKYITPSGVSAMGVGGELGSERSRLIDWLCHDIRYPN